MESVEALTSWSLMELLIVLKFTTFIKKLLWLSFYATLCPLNGDWGMWEINEGEIKEQEGLPHLNICMYMTYILKQRLKIA